MKASMAKFAATMFKAGHIFIVSLYLLACLTPVLPAGKFWMIATLGLVFPLLFVIVVVFLIGWIIAKSRWFILSLVAIILSWQQLSAVAALNKEKDFTLSKSNETLRLLSWNLSSWGETSKNRKREVKYLPLMLGIIKMQQADVLCFQEFWDKKYPDLKYSNVRIFKEMGYSYSYYVKTAFDIVEPEMGVVIFSKYPIINAAEFNYGEDDLAEHLIYADILFNQQRVRVFTTHLQSVRFDDTEYSAISKIKHRDESGLKDSKTIARKLKRAYGFRDTQADFVHQKIKESPYPVIICGDFNDVPNSYTYFTIKEGLQDAFLKKGSGIGRTFQYLFPTLRIDYILSDKNLAVAQFNRIKAPYSDHYPIMADFNVGTAP